MAQKQLSGTDPDFVPVGKFGYCCKDPSCKYLVHNYRTCKMCHCVCLGCLHDHPEKRRRF
jgi:hypothetical protein